MNIACICGATGRSTGFALMVIFFAVNLPDTFLTPRNLLNVTQQISMLAVVAFTMTVVMSMGDFDLSVGAMASLAGVVAATLFVAGWPVGWAIAAALGVGLAGRAVQRVSGQPPGHPALRRHARDDDRLRRSRLRRVGRAHDLRAGYSGELSRASRAAGSSWASGASRP
jgi:hypothetical protein